MDIDWKTIGPTWRAILVAVFDAGYACGGGEAVTLPTHGETQELLLNVMARWEGEADAGEGWGKEPQLLADDVPGWLLSQQQQKEAAS